MVMTDSQVPGVDDRVEDTAEEMLLTTGEAAEVIGFHTTRKQVIAMIANNRIAYLRPRPGAWARIPLSAALAKRRELARTLADSEARVRSREQSERERQESGES